MKSNNLKKVIIFAGEPVLTGLLIALLSVGALLGSGDDALQFWVVSDDRMAIHRG